VQKYFDVNFKMIARSQHLFWNSKQNIPLRSKMNLLEEYILKQA